MTTRKQEPERGYRKRLTIELHPDEETFVREVHGRAIANGSTLRDWVLEAMREKAAQENPQPPANKA